jgi:hypothetical protein
MRMAGMLDESQLARWEFDDIAVSLAAPGRRRPWGLDVRITRRATGEDALFLWDVRHPHALISSAAEERGPSWDGRPLKGGRLLVTSNQGIGDFLQGLRYLPTICRHVAHVAVECRPELRHLVAAQNLGAALVLPGKADEQSGTLTVPLERLVRFVAPVTCPYVAPPAACGLDLPRPRPGGLRIGINWTVNLRADACEIRNLPLAALRPLIAGNEAHSWTSLQWGEAERELADHAWAAAVFPAGRHCRDVADMAAIMAALDLVITADSGPAHLAGAMGRPVWNLLSRPCAWRWGLIESHTSLYPSMRLFRQPDPGAWSPVVEEVGEALAEVGARGQLLSDPAGGSAPEADRRRAQERFPPSALNDARFVADPIGALVVAGTPPASHDYAIFAQLFTRMVKCYGGFCWCRPVPQADDATCFPGLRTNSART